MGNIVYIKIRFQDHNADRGDANLQFKHLTLENSICEVQIWAIFVNGL